MDIKKVKIKNDNHLYHITTISNLHQIIQDKELKGKNKIKLHIGNKEIRPLSLTKDRTLKYKNDYFNSLEVLIQLDESARNLPYIKDISYDAKSLIFSNEGQSILRYILGEETGETVLLNLAQKITDGNYSENELCSYVQPYLDRFKFEEEVVSLDSISTEYITMVQFYLKSDNIVEINRIKEVMALIPNVKCAVVNKDGKAVYKQSTGWLI